jgi:hypothetical protein
MPRCPCCLAFHADLQSVFELGHSRCLSLLLRSGNQSSNGRLLRRLPKCRACSRLAGTRLAKSSVWCRRTASRSALWIFVDQSVAACCVLVYTMDVCCFHRGCCCIQAAFMKIQKTDLCLATCSISFSQQPTQAGTLAASAWRLVRRSVQLSCSSCSLDRVYIACYIA